MTTETAKPSVAIAEAVEHTASRGRDAFFAEAKEREEALGAVVVELATDREIDPEELVQIAVDRNLGDEESVRRNLWVLASKRQLEFTDDMLIRST